MRAAVIGGTGALGWGLTLRLAKAGVSVIIGSRTEEKAAASAAEANQILGAEQVQGLSNADAARAADLVVLAVPVAAQEATLAQIAPHMGGKVLIDTTVSLAEGDPTRIVPPAEGSAAERVQALLPAARVVSALHTVSGKLLASLDKPIDCDILVAGDDQDAKQQAIALIEKIGVRALDAGPLRNSQSLERMTALIIGMNIRYKRRHIGVRFTGV